MGTDLRGHRSILGPRYRRTQVPPRASSERMRSRELVARASPATMPLVSERCAFAIYGRMSGPVCQDLDDGATSRRVDLPSISSRASSACGPRGKRSVGRLSAATFPLSKPRRAAPPR